VMEKEKTMKLTGLHILLTYQCTFECDHCFVWCSPRQSGVLTLEQIHEILHQAHEIDSMEWVYFEGGEPFLYYPVLLRAVQMATAAGFRTGIVSNAYWATTSEDALAWLKPFADLIEDLTVSSDLYHYTEADSQHARNAAQAAGQLGIPLGRICVAQPEQANSALSVGQIPVGESAVMYRGRAACKLASRAVLQPWDKFTACSHEDLREPGRIHLDALGNLHLCQGLSIGNIFQRPLRDICDSYDPAAHPICGPLLAGGPVALVETYSLPHASAYADACHLCYEARLALRERFPEILVPDQMYGG
jgi:hypothetical protein